jgi:hypothetical protein
MEDECNFHVDKEKAKFGEYNKINRLVEVSVSNRISVCAPSCCGPNRELKVTPHGSQNAH